MTGRHEQLDALLRHCAGEGLAVIECPLPDGVVGAYDLRGGVIYLRHGMTVPQRLATLAHEVRHHELGHDGHQSVAVEARINEDVARALISPAEYALAEQLHEGRTGAIALELDLPRWVVSAYRAPLWRGEGVRRDEEVVWHAVAHGCGCRASGL